MEQHLKFAEFLADIMDRKFRIGNFRFGLDPVIGALPGVGDLVTFSISFYLVWIGIRLRLPQEKIAMMIGNITIDFLIGLIPLLGDFIDVVYKANSRNLAIIKRYARKNVVEGQIT